MATLGEHLASTLGAGLAWELPVPTSDFEGEFDQSVRADLARLEGRFRRSFSLVDSDSGKVLRTSAEGQPHDLDRLWPLLASAARQGQPEIILDEPPVVTLAVPLRADDRRGFVALSTFVTERIRRDVEVRPAARVLGVDVETLWKWARQQPIWPVHAIQRVAEAFIENQSSHRTIAELERQFADVSSQLLNTFEEIALLHRLTQHLSLSKDIHELVELAAIWLADVVPAECIAIRLKLDHEQDAARSTSADKSVLATYGDFPLTEDEVVAVVQELGPAAFRESLVRNDLGTNGGDWRYPHIRQIVCVPIREGEQCFGWILALNHTGRRTKSTCEDTFGTVEASLMASVAVILGIHSGNLQLYRDQADFFASMVRAMISAVDAKDPYTCGHSERVAHISVCLARQLGCTQKELNTIYLSGLLHDIGKIGINTDVLRKPGALTEEEYEHVKQHPQMGYQILHGVKQLDQVLPVVLHHHEAWDGSGYPHGLRGNECPRLARIAAVADSIDAMSSDRPYRRGMPDEKLDDILRSGAGKQWDPDVIEALFRVRDQIRTICQLNRDVRSLDVAQWRD
jgi:HD-GYP domain-containing protein (c-di-GMP phosphodiesterase class II)